MESSSTPRKEKKGLGRLWAKVKLAIKSKSSSKARSTPATAGITEAQPQSSQPGHSVTMSAPTNKDSIPSIQPEPSLSSSQPPMAVSVPVPSTQDTTPIPLASTTETEERPTTESQPEVQPDLAEQPGPEKPTEVVREGNAPPEGKEELARRYGRAQAIFRKYNMELDEASWDSQPQPQIQIERVYKAPRIRVRYTCHECKTTFGHDRVCAECAHQRCKTCPRYPPKKKKAKAAKMAAFANTLTEPTQDEDTEMRDGVCHECQTSFEMGSEECSNCHHKICDRCLQETIMTAERSEAHAVET